MNDRLLESQDTREEHGILAALAQNEAPAFATDPAGHVVFWNRAAEQLFGRTSRQVLGRRCYDVVGGRDVFGNRFCHENCAVLSMSRKGEALRGFELELGDGVPKQHQTVHVSVLKAKGASSEPLTLVHVLQPIDRTARLARALEQLTVANGNDPLSSAGLEPAPPPSPASGEASVLTEREKQILRSIAEGLPNKEIAVRLGISLATVRNHVHNILEKLEVHSKLEAASLAFRQGWVSAPHR